jgi:hypothetical protein
VWCDSLLDFQRKETNTVGLASDMRALS